MEFDIFDIEELYQKFFAQTGNAQAAATLAHAETIRRIVADGIMESAIEGGIRFGLLGDDESLFDIFFAVAERFAKPLPLETSPEPADVDAANLELQQVDEDQRAKETE